jgi:hypothetical protein
MSIARTLELAQHASDSAAVLALFPELSWRTRSTILRSRTHCWMRSSWRLPTRLYGSRGMEARQVCGTRRE